MRKNWFVFALAILLVAGSASAQHKEWWGFFTGSYVMPMGETADNLDDDFGFSGGAIWRPNGANYGISGELAWNEFDAPSRTVLTDNNVNLLLEGHAEVWSLTVNGMYNFPSSGRTQFYVIGGAGAYKRNLEVTTPAGYDFIVWCDPWWGWCYSDAVPVNAVLLDKDDTNLGINAGIGLTIETGYSSEMFIESRYNWIDSDPASTEYIPLSVGFRF